jgi:hypothetical protein
MISFLFEVAVAAVFGAIMIAVLLCAFLGTLFIIGAVIYLFVILGMDLAFWLKYKIKK